MGTMQIARSLLSRPLPARVILQSIKKIRPLTVQLQQNPAHAAGVLFPLFPAPDKSPRWYSVSRFLGKTLMSNASVNAAATQSGVLKRNRTAVLGVFGAQGNMRALVRTASGRVQEVKTGARINSAKVVAIDKNGVVVQKNGRTERLNIAGS